MVNTTIVFIVVIIIIMAIALYLASWAVPVMGPLSLPCLSFLHKCASYSAAAYLLLQMPKNLVPEAPPEYK